MSRSCPSSTTSGGSTAWWGDRDRRRRPGDGLGGVHPARRHRPAPRRAGPGRGARADRPRPGRPRRQAGGAVAGRRRLAQPVPQQRRAAAAARRARRGAPPRGGRAVLRRRARRPVDAVQPLADPGPGRARLGAGGPPSAHAAPARGHHAPGPAGAGDPAGHQGAGPGRLRGHPGRGLPAGRAPVAPPRPPVPPRCARRWAAALLGRVGGRPPGERRRLLGDRRRGGRRLGGDPAAGAPAGYGAALTWRATLTEAGLPAILLASDDGRPVYQRMGFLPLLRFTVWQHPRHSPARLSAQVVTAAAGRGTLRP
jgi:hypothetical protein